MRPLWAAGTSKAGGDRTGVRPWRKALAQDPEPPEGRLLGSPTLSPPQQPAGAGPGPGCLGPAG